MRKENEMEMGMKQEKKGSIISVFLLAFLALVVVFIAMVVMERSILNKDQKKEIIVMTKDTLPGGVIPAGSYIASGELSKYFEECEVDAAVVPKNAYHSLKELEEAYVACDLYENTILIDSWFTGSVKPAAIEKPVQVSFTVDNLGAAVAGTLRKGDYVSVGTVTKNENNEFDVTQIVECVLLDEAYTAEGVVASSLVGNEATMFTITIPAESVDIFLKSCANGTLVVGKVIEE